MQKILSSRCESVCPDGWFGEHCNSKCKCNNSGRCLHTTGACICPPGKEVIIIDFIWINVLTAEYFKNYTRSIFKRCNLWCANLCVTNI